MYKVVFWNTVLGRYNFSEAFKTEAEMKTFVEVLKKNPHINYSIKKVGA